jgi:hypothetical protein
MKDLVDHVVGKVLVQVGQRIGILAQGLVLATETISRCDLSEPDQIDDIERADVVGLARQVVPPVPGFPEPEPFHVFVRVAEWGVAVRSSSKVEIAELLQVGSDNLKNVIISVSARAV